jgi:hypothetical protein
MPENAHRYAAIGLALSGDPDGERHGEVLLKTNIGRSWKRPKSLAPEVDGEQGKDDSEANFPPHDTVNP